MRLIFAAVLGGVVSAACPGPNLGVCMISEVLFWGPHMSDPVIWLFPYIGVHLLGVLIIWTLPFWVSIRAPDFWKLPF